MKKILIISPHFPPINAADMHRVRQMLPYLESLGWKAEVITVHPNYIESYSEDKLLLKTLPQNTIVHYVKALNIKITRKFGLGSLSMRSFFNFKRAGNKLLSSERFDLVFFSTTAFHVMALGPYWKRKFKIPFILDIQDPWRNDFYLNKPKSERPPKFIISYNIDKYLEAKTIPYADAIISVSDEYCKTFVERYNYSKAKCNVIPFGGAQSDYDIVKIEKIEAKAIILKEDKINIVYIGRGGHDLRFAIQVFFSAIRKGLDEKNQNFKKIHCWFIGTSYAPAGKGAKTVEPIALEENLSACVTEITDRIPYFETLALLKKADLLFVPGSTDEGYTASKIYPYILAEKPLLAIFYEKSSVIKVLCDSKTGNLITFSKQPKITKEIVSNVYEKLCAILNDFNRDRANHSFDPKGFYPYTAEFMTQKIVNVFNAVLR